MENRNHGFNASVIDSQHYVFGDSCLATEILVPDGHGWGDYLPQDDFQDRNGLETMNCTNYGTLHALATLGKRKFGILFQQNLSERYTGIMTGTNLGGNDPHNVIEEIRKDCGVIPEVYLPFDNTIFSWNTYYSPKPMTYDLYKIGAHWLKKYNVGHDWTFLPAEPLATKQAKMKEALKYSPLGASGYAWSMHADGMYYCDGADNHWFTVYDFVDGKYWMIFDSYDSTHKKLEWNYNFGQCKRYTLSLNLGAENLPDIPPTDNWMVDLIKRFMFALKK